MTKIAILIVLVLHGSIHILGFVKAFELTEVDELKGEISKTAGIFWLLAVFGFIVAAVLLYLGDDTWRMVGGAAVIISQLLIMLSWSDAKYGTIANVVVAAAIVLGVGNRISEDYSVKNLNQRQFSEYLDRQIPMLMEDYSVPGVSILILKDGKKQWSRAYGYADRQHQQSLTVESVMMAHSISKSVTAWGVMKLVEEGQVRLDDPLSKYLDSWTLPESEFSHQKVTVRRLLSNSAGVSLGTLGVHYAPSESIPPLTESLSGDEVRLVRPPGTVFMYSNSGYALLELLIQEVTGMDFAEYMENEILMPLGMNKSSFELDNEIVSEVPLGYDLNGNTVSVYRYPYRASGGLFSTLGDIGTFVASGFSEQAAETVLLQESIDELYKPQISVSGMFGYVADSYGMGHFIEMLPNGDKAVWHGGQGLGWMTHFHAIPERGDGIVILTNSQRSWPLMAQILGDWSEWGGYGPVKFSRITYANTGLQFLIGIILLITFWRMGEVISGVLSGRRKLTLGSEAASNIRVIEFVISLGIMAFLIWASVQDYLFISSVFPIGAVWLGWVLLVLSGILLLSAALPVIQMAVPSNPDHTEL